MDRKELFEKKPKIKIDDKISFYSHCFTFNLQVEQAIMYSGLFLPYINKMGFNF